MCTVQGVCVELLGWWSSNYRLSHIGVRCMDPSSIVARHAKTYDDFPIIFLLEEAVLLLEYKIQVQQNNRPGAPGCSTSALHGQILNVVKLFGEEAVNLWNDLVALLPNFVMSSCQLGVLRRNTSKWWNGILLRCLVRANFSSLTHTDF